MGWLAQVAMLVAGGLIVAGVWRLGRPRRLFAVRIAPDSRARTVHGKVAPSFLERVREVAAAHGLKSGRIAGIDRGERVQLEFSRGFPEPARQQLRNWWVASTWGERPRGRNPR